jgi:hypothetical protein
MAVGAESKTPRLGLARRKRGRPTRAERRERGLAQVIALHVRQLVAAIVSEETRVVAGEVFALFR